MVEGGDLRTNRFLRLLRRLLAFLDRRRETLPDGLVDLLPRTTLRLTPGRRKRGRDAPCLRPPTPSRLRCARPAAMRGNAWRSWRERSGWWLGWQRETIRADGADRVTVLPLFLFTMASFAGEAMLIEAMGRMLLEDLQLEQVESPKVMPKVDFWKLFER